MACNRQLLTNTSICSIMLRGARCLACVLDHLCSTSPATWAGMNMVQPTSLEIITQASRPRMQEPLVWPCLLQPSRGMAAETNLRQAQEDSKVKVVLLQDVYRLGKKGEVRFANPGWVRLHLFPRGAAVYATPENVARFAKAEDDADKSEASSIDKAEQEIVDILKRLSRGFVNISRKAVEPKDAAQQQQNPDGKDVTEGPVQMQGRVTSWDIRQAVMRQKGVQLDDSHMLMGESITQFGTFKVPLNLRMLDDHQVELTVRVHRVNELRYGKASV